MTSFDLDEVLDREIKFGSFQILIFILMAFPIFLNGIASSSYIFTAGNLNYRCKVPECDVGDNDTSYMTEWLNLSTPTDVNRNLPDKCSRFAPVRETCEHDSFNRSATIKCNEFIYEDDEVTILNEFNLNCDEEFRLSVLGSFNNIGQLLCYFAAGLISDKYGRKLVLVFGMLGSGLSGLMRAFSPTYVQFATFEFMDSFLGAATYSTAVIIGLELVTPKFRTIYGNLLNCFYAFGEIYLGFIAMWFPNYKTILMVTYLPSLVAVSYIWILPQSIRWLITQKRNEEAKLILIKASKMNNTNLSDNSKLLLDKGINHKEVEEGLDDAEFHDEKVNSTAQIVLRILSLSYIWFATAFVYIGLNVNAVYLEHWNKYISFIVVCSIELPSYFLATILMDNLGRKKTLYIGMIGSGIFCILSEIFTGNIVKTAFFAVGKMLISVSFSCLYIYTVEVFPTKQRHRFFSICSVVGTIGSILAPLTPMLAQQIAPSLPLILFSSFALTSSILLCYLPETLNTKMPDTIDEAFE